MLSLQYSTDFFYIPIRQAMKCDGSFVIVINLSISLLYSQAGGFFVLNSQRSKYLGDKKQQSPTFTSQGSRFFKVFLLYKFPFTGKAYSKTNIFQSNLFTLQYSCFIYFILLCHLKWL